MVHSMPTTTVLVLRPCISTPQLFIAIPLYSNYKEKKQAPMEVCHRVFSHLPYISNVLYAYALLSSKLFWIYKKKLTSIVAVVAFAATTTSATKQEGRYHNSIVWVMKDRSPPPYSTAVGYPSYLAVVYFFLLKTAPSYPPVTLSRLERYMHPRVALCRVFRRWRIVGSFQLPTGAVSAKKKTTMWLW